MGPAAVYWAPRMADRAYIERTLECASSCQLNRVESVNGTPTVHLNPLLSSELTSARTGNSAPTLSTSELSALLLRRWGFCARNMAYLC